MDVSSLGSSVAAPRSTAATSTEIADTTHSRHQTKRRYLRSQTRSEVRSALFLLQTSSDLGGEEEKCCESG